AWTRCRFTDRWFIPGKLLSQGATCGFNIGQIRGFICHKRCRYRHDIGISGRSICRGTEPTRFYVSLDEVSELRFNKWNMACVDCIHIMLIYVYAVYTQTVVSQDCGSRQADVAQSDDSNTGNV